MQLPFRSYEEAATVPNVVVDGSPTPATTLVLSHWPRIPQPGELVSSDVSAGMALRYLDADEPLHGDASCVTNNHFDQDGTAGLFAFVAPEEAWPRRHRVEQLARAGDFATYVDRDAARASMVISAFSEDDRSPLAPLPAGHGERTALLYGEVLPRVAELLDDVGRYRSLWHDEDLQLQESEDALASGVVTVDEHEAVDAAVVTVRGTTRWSGHRFGGRRYEGVHPMALHNATERNVIILRDETVRRLTYRYESWVQYRSRAVRPRVDLRPLAEELTAADEVGWVAEAPDALTAELRPEGQSALAAEVVVERMLGHLRTAPVAFDPFPSGSRASRG